MPLIGQCNISPKCLTANFNTRRLSGPECERTADELLSSIPIMWEWDPEWANRRVLVIETGSWTPHLETSLEISLRLAEEGAKVDYRFLGQNFKFVEGFQSRSAITALLRRLRLAPEARGMKIASAYSESTCLRASFHYFGSDCELAPLSFKYPTTLAELRTIQMDSCRIGLGALSSLLSRTKSSSPDLGEHKSLVLGLIEDSRRAIGLIAQLLTSEKYDAVVLFNGRFAVQRAISDYCTNNGVPVFFHERGSTCARFWFSEFQTHDLNRMRQLLFRSWHQALLDDQEAAVSLARTFFQRRREGDGIGWKSFTSSQQPGLLLQSRPELRGAKIYSFFTTSDDEYVAAFDDTSASSWNDQFEMIGDVIQLAKEKGAKVAIRVHPHMREKSVEDRLRWKSFLSRITESEVVIFDEDSQISTYELIDCSDVVFSAGSTVGIEAVYWGRHSVLMADALYDSGSLGIMRARGREHLEEQLDLFVKRRINRDDALPFGYFLLTFGDSFRFFEPSGLKDGYFLGKRLQRKNFLLKAMNKARALFLDPRVKDKNTQSTQTESGAFHR